MRLRKVAGEWFPTIPVAVLDRIVAAAWIEGRDANGGSGERTAVVAAAAVRRHGLRALRGEEIDIPEDAEQRIAALTSSEPTMPEAERSQRFRRRARPEALGRRAPEAPAVDDQPTLEPDPTIRSLQRDDEPEDDRPPTRRRRGNRNEERNAAQARATADAESERGLRSLRILAETVQIITGRRTDDDKEIVEIVAEEAPARTPKPGRERAAKAAPRAAKPAPPVAKAAPPVAKAGPPAAKAAVAQPAPPASPQAPTPEAAKSTPAPKLAAAAAPAVRAPAAKIKRPATQPATVVPAPTPAPAPVAAAGAPVQAAVGPVRASAARPAATSSPATSASARRPPALPGRVQGASLRRALPFAAIAAAAIVVIALASSVFGSDNAGTRVALVRAPGGATDIAQVVQTTAAKTQAARVAAERELRARLAADRRAAAHRRAVAAKRKAAAKRRAAAKHRAAAARKAAARRRALPPARSVPAPQPAPQPVYHAPSGGSSSGGGAWGGEFGP
jgi:hypothetical protein